MAQIIWTLPAVEDLDAIADYIAVEDPAAAAILVQKVLAHIGQLESHPESGSRPKELGSRTRYRQIIEPPCRVIYRFDGQQAIILHVMRSERSLRRSRLTRSKPKR